MILRRVIEHFRKQEWTAIFLDFVIVVVGVFVGLQVSNWNAERQRAARAEEVRGRLVDNIRSDMDVFTVRGRYFSEALAYGEAARRTIEGAPTDDAAAQWRFVLAAYEAGQVWPFRPSAQVYDELKSAGELDLLGGLDVQDALTDYYEEGKTQIGLVLGALDPYRALIRRRTPWPLQEYIWTKCHPNESVDARRAVPPPEFRFMLDCTPPPDEDLVRQAALSLASDREVADYLNGRLAELRVTLNFIENSQRGANGVIALLEAEGKGEAK